MPKEYTRNAFLMDMLKESNGTKYIPNALMVGVFDSVNHKWYGNRMFQKEELDEIMEAYKVALQNMYDYQDERDGIPSMTRIREFENLRKEVTKDG